MQCVRDDHVDYLLNLVYGQECSRAISSSVTHPHAKGAGGCVKPEWIQGVSATFAIKLNIQVSVCVWSEDRR